MRIFPRLSSAEQPERECFTQPGSTEDLHMVAKTLYEFMVLMSSDFSPNVEAFMETVAELGAATYRQENGDGA